MFAAVRRAKGLGFTLIEAINALTLVCVAGAVAMYLYARYTRRERMREAENELSSIARLAAAYYEGSDANQPAGTPPDAAQAMRHFPPSSHESVPKTVPRGKKYASTQADWSGSPWAELHFSIGQPQYYAYSFESQGRGRQAKCTVMAQGDLDADGKLSRFAVTITADDTLHATIAPMVEQDPEE